jgi:hypothetical protein
VLLDLDRNIAPKLFHCLKELLFGSVHVEQVFICIVLSAHSQRRRKDLWE